MLALNANHAHNTLSPAGPFPSLTNGHRSDLIASQASSHPPRTASLAQKSASLPQHQHSQHAKHEPKYQLKQQSHLSAVAPVPRLSTRIIERPKDIQIDYWTRKIFSIINDGPPGGFVRYAISSNNELYVDQTGNRASTEDFADDLALIEGCRFIAYKLKYLRKDVEKLKVVWLMWTPKDTPSKDTLPYIDGLAGALIGLECPSSIPIIEAATADDLTTDQVVSKVK